MKARDLFLFLAGAGTGALAAVVAMVLIGDVVLFRH